MRSLLRGAAAALVLVAAGAGALPVAAQPVLEEGQAPDDAARLNDAPAVAVPSEDSRMRAFLATLRPRAIEMGVSPTLFDATLPTINFNARVVRLDRAQPGASAAYSASPPFAPYLASHVDRVRIGMGRSRYGNLRPLLLRIEQETGVPEQIMLAIYGHETGYGTFTGNFDLLNALGTLAYEGRRRELFAEEFLKTLVLMSRGVPRAQLKGSWAGATGYPQFLPSVYLRLAIDADGDGKPDIWRSEPDALASIGNYLRDAGWKKGVPWGVAVRLPEGIDRAAIRSPLSSPRCPRVFARQSRWLTIAEWRDKGVQMLGGRVPPENELATLIEPDGSGNTAYLLTTNYRSILDYNCSNFYALSVGLLGDAIVE
ncbi:lytic murein transglycosylase [Rhizorhabdus dicambivorans]|uniref:Lytic murein transglycosylase n=1 Tax=Rhizorhabdus dicambivorans TaxID=1850238 RepID=A0A2A4FUF9_9SPHN|nr:lytic murein transglycosylase [Rhizorhabdus dicambivorans]ATE65273.1 lytic murein transglycosylase [Rhizorhabdus dicambivorans]PCE42402.1 lytic murein transglycosylase [Rhizorhabdus dicambivorans]